VVRNLVSCRDGSECDRYWAQATAYVREHATTEVQSVGRRLLITAPPAALGDLSLTLSRIEDVPGGAASIFLDLQCKNTLPSDTDCHDERSVRVIEGFRAAVTSETAPLGPAASR
jgi:hypothetical protein